MFQLKNKPMAFQIWIILGLVLGLSFVLLTILFPVVLRHSFTNEIYDRIVETQEYILKFEFLEEMTNNKFFVVKPEREKQQPPFRIIRHILLLEKGIPVSRELPVEIINQMKQEAKMQAEDIKHYHKKVDVSEIFYVIRRVQLGGEDAYLVSYLWERYRENLVENTFRRLIGLLVFILFISWIASIAIAKYLTRPLVHLQSRVRDIAARKWEKPVLLDREDEIGEFGKTIDWMRKQLLEQEQKQQSFLQQVSHELKTPVMVIRSYVHSINDGIFPRGDMESSLKVIEEETERLEKRVHFLLGYTKYEYLANHQLEEKKFDMAELIKKTALNFMWRNADLTWELELDPVMIKGDKEKLRIVLENIFDNQIRYAKDTISIELKEDKQVINSILRNNKTGEKEDYTCLLRIWNNGPEIEESVMGSIFKKYEKGYEGNFGLGLAIVKLIIELHKGLVWVNNEDSGVAFYIVL